MDIIPELQLKGKGLHDLKDPHRCQLHLCKCLQSKWQLLQLQFNTDYLSVAFLISLVTSDLDISHCPTRCRKQIVEIHQHTQQKSNLTLSWGNANLTSSNLNFIHLRFNLPKKHKSPNIVMKMPTMISITQNIWLLTIW